MKKINRIHVLMLAGLAVAAAACQREEDFQEKGNEVVFSLATGYQNAPSTRTEYSGQRYAVGSDSYERINWVANDVIRVASDKAATTGGVKHTDYTVQSAIAENEKSIAGASAATPLIWGEGTNKFFGLYPAPGAAGVDDGVSFTDGGVATLVLPADQTDITMKYAYMGAATSASDGESVSLNFKPLMNAFCFMLKGDEATGMKLKSLTLSSADAFLAAPSYTVTLNAGDNSFGNVSYTEGTASKSITATFDNGVELPTEGNPFTFTMFALPQEQTNFSLSLTFVEGGVEKTESFELTGLTVKAGQKVVISSTNVTVPDTWIYVLDSPEDFIVTYEGGTGNIASSFKSYRYKSYDPSIKEPVPFTLQFSEDQGETFSTEPPSWLTMEKSYTGSIAGQAISCTVAPQENTPFLHPSSHHDELASRPAKTNFDLSTINVATGATVTRTTANCYVVQASGTYSFPLVYGNGRVNGAVNESAFRAQDTEKFGTIPREGKVIRTINHPSGVVETRLLGRYIDHLGNYIFDPDIPDHLSGKTLTAELIAQDAEGLVTDVQIDGGSITFKVPKENITQGNAIIAVKADGVIAWSWHIWVTDKDLTDTFSVTDSRGNNYSFAPAYLGYCETIADEYYRQRTCQLSIVQEGSGRNTDGYVGQSPYEHMFYANATMYQRGRKDALGASCGPTHEEPDVLSPNAEEKPYYPGGRTVDFTVLARSYQESIQNPWTFFTHPSANNHSGEPTNDWCIVHYDNLWNSSYEGSVDQTSTNSYGDYSPEYLSNYPGAYAHVTKTIYDPSPVGFKVPPIGAFEGFNKVIFPKYEMNGTSPWGTFKFYVHRFNSDSDYEFPSLGKRARTTGLFHEVWQTIQVNTGTMTDDPGQGMYFHVSTDNDLSMQNQGLISGNRGYGNAVMPIVDN